MNQWLSMLTQVKNHPGTTRPRLSLKKLYTKRLLSENSLAFLLQYIGLMISPPSASMPLWFASGTACAFIFMRQSYILPGIWAGTFLVYFSEKMGIYFSCSAATLFSLQAFLLLQMSHRYIGPTLLFYQLKPFFKFIGYSALCTLLISGGLVMVYAQVFSIRQPLTLGLHWWLANLLGTCIISFGILTLDAYFAEIDCLRKFRLKQWLPFVLIVLLYIVPLFLREIATVFLINGILFLLLFRMSRRYGWCAAVFILFAGGLIDNLAVSFSLPVWMNSAKNVLCYQLFIFMALIISLSISIKRSFSQ